MTSTLRLFFALLLALPLAAAGQAPGAIVAEPEVQSPVAQPRSARKAARAGQALRVALGLPTSDERSQITPPRKGAPQRVGFPRPVAPLVGGLPAALEWELLEAGQQVAAIEITSPEAAALRLGLRVIAVPAAARLRFYAPSSDEVHEVTGQEVSDAIARNLASGETGDDARTFWSPLIEGPTIVMEIELPASARRSDLRIAVPRLSHLVTSARTGFTLPNSAASCNNDATCSSSTWPEVNAVARMTYVNGGFSYNCTGTLLADRDTSTTIPYFLTARHCISTQSSATSLVTHWFFRSSVCNGNTGNYETRSGGALLLYASPTLGAYTDTTLLRLNDTPPVGAVYAGWIVDVPAANGAPVTGLHHPAGDALKISFGNVDGYWSCTAPSSEGNFSCSPATVAAATYYGVAWADGITQGGSSGSGIFRNNGSYLVGQLYGGSSSCSDPAAGDFYGRFDTAYNRALFQWLGVTTPTPARTLGVTLAGTGTVTSSPAGIACGTTCSASFPDATLVTLTATSQGSTFVGWSGGGCSGTGTCLVTLTADAAVTASFQSVPTPPGPTNVALASAGAVATASSIYGLGYPALSVNNNERAGTNWGAGGGWNDGNGGAYPDWVQIDFNGYKTIDRVVVYTVQDNYSSPVEPTDTSTFSLYGLVDFTVQGWDGASWITLGTVAGNNLVKRTVTFAAYTTNRIRVNATNGRGGYSRITEVAAWGVAAPAPASSNVALASTGALATASSIYGLGYPALSVNNNERAGTNWGAGGGWNDANGGAYPDWVQIDFNGYKTIDRAVVYTVQDNYANPIEPTNTSTFSLYGLVDFTVQGWNGSSWVTLGTVTGNSLVKRTVTFAAYTTNRIRVSVTNGKGGFSRITEIEAWGVPASASGTNVALASAGAAATSSSVYGPGWPATSVNNNERAGTSWGSGGGWNDGTAGVYPDWVEIDFNATRTINRVVVYTVQDNYASPVAPTDTATFALYGLVDFTVQGWNGSAWVTLGTVSGNNLVKRTVSFLAFTTTRIRVNVTNGMGGYSRITEVEAWEG